MLITIIRSICHETSPVPSSHFQRAGDTYMGKKAGTVILGISIILWAMMTFPGLPDSRVQEFENMRETVRVASGATVIQGLEASG